MTILAIYIIGYVISVLIIGRIVASIEKNDIAIGALAMALAWPITLPLCIFIWLALYCAIWWSELYYDSRWRRMGRALEWIVTGKRHAR